MQHPGMELGAEVLKAEPLNLKKKGLAGWLSLLYLACLCLISL